MVIIWTSILCAVLVLGLELLHARRIRRIAYLAFGPTGRPARWVCALPALRALGMGMAIFGALVLFSFNPSEPPLFRSARASRQLLICLDVSPSMHLPDAGPEHARTTRAERAGEVIQTLLDHTDFAETRATLIGFYTKAVPIAVDTSDPGVIANSMRGLPLYKAFDAGESDLAVGLNAALQMAHSWARGSTTLVIVSDGDVNANPAILQRPSSIADVLVVGVGDTKRASLISGHQSRQDSASLRSIAARLGGRYTDANVVGIPVAAITSLHALPPEVASKWTDYQTGLVTLGTGSSILALIGPFLARFGSPSPMQREPRPDRASSTRSPLPLSGVLS